MGMSIGELFVSLGFDVDDGKLKAFNDSIKTASTELLKLSAIATGGIYSLNAFLEGSIGRAFNLKNFQIETGQATEGLQRFQSVVNQVNGAISTSEAAARYRALADAMTDISQAGGGGSLARLTGGAFHIGMKEEDVIEAIRNYKQQFIRENGGGQIGVAAHARLLEQIGLGAGTEKAFDLSQAQYNAISQPFIRSDETIAGTVKLGNAIEKLNQEWDKFKDDLVGDWADNLIAAMHRVEDFIKDFRLSLIAVLNEWQKWPDIIKTASEILLATLAIWAVPFGTTLAVVTAIGAAIWDIGRAIRGLPSFTGSFFESFRNGWNLLTRHPGQWADNFNGNVDRLLGVDNRNANWFGSDKINPSTINAPQTVHAQIFSKADADDLVESFMKQNQRQLNTSIMSLIGRPAH